MLNKCTKNVRPIRSRQLSDYKGELTTKLTDAWRLTCEQIKQLQALQKQYYDTFANEHSIHMGDQVYMYTLAKKVGTAYKFASPFVDPTGC